MMMMTHNHTRDEFLRTVAESIELRLGVPPGRGLVGLIGDGHERNNRDALINWIGRQWDIDAREDARTATDTLCDDLLATLELDH